MDSPAPASKSNRGGSKGKGLRAIIEWVYSLPLTFQQQAVMLIHAHHCDHWNGQNSRPGTALIMQRTRLSSKRRVQQIHRELQADPPCADCHGSGSLRDTHGRASRCPCFRLRSGPLICVQEPHGNAPGVYRLNLVLRPWRPVQMPLADPLPTLISACTSLAGEPTNRVNADLLPPIPARTSPSEEPSSRVSADFSTASTHLTAAGETAKFSPSESEIFVASERNFAGGLSEISNIAIRKTLTDLNDLNDLNTPTPSASARCSPSPPESQDEKPIAKSQEPNYSLDDFQAWLSIKGALRHRLSAKEWDLWVRPMRLLWSTHGVLIIGLPANAKIMQQAADNKLLLREVAASFGRSIGLTRYPDDYEIERIRELTGRDLSRKKPAASTSSTKSTAAEKRGRK